MKEVSIRLKMGILMGMFIGVSFLLSFINWIKVHDIKILEKKAYLWEEIDMEFNEDIHIPLIELKANLLAHKQDVSQSISLIKKNLNKLNKLIASTNNSELQKGIKYIGDNVALIEDYVNHEYRDKNTNVKKIFPVKEIFFYGAE